MSENKSAAVQICNKLIKRGIECEEISPGNFSILYGGCSLIYYGNGVWIFRWPFYRSWRFYSKSTSDIVNLITEYIISYIESLDSDKILI